VSRGRSNFLCEKLNNKPALKITSYKWDCSFLYTYIGYLNISTPLKNKVGNPAQEPAKQSLDYRDLMDF